MGYITAKISGPRQNDARIVGAGVVTSGHRFNPYLDKEIRVLDFLTGRECDDLHAFLESLSGETPANVGPPEEKGRQARLLSKPRGR